MTIIMKKYNPDLCDASRNQNKNKYEQCPHMKQKNTNFCGRHKNFKKDTYLSIYQDLTYPSNNIIKEEDIIKEGDNIKDSNNCNSNNSNNDNINNNDGCKINNLRCKNNDKYEMNDLKNNRLKNRNTNYKIKLSVKNNEIFDKMMKNREKYLKLNDKELTILDYFFDEKLESISKRKLQMFFNTHSLEFNRVELLQLSNLKRTYLKYNSKEKRMEEITEDEDVDGNKDKNKEIFNKLKDEFILERVKSFFDTLFIAMLHIDKVILIQKKIRQYYIRKNLKLRGPALYYRKLCVNDTDFYSFDAIDEIPSNEFFSYKDKNGFVYGFDIDSIYELFKRKEGKVNNPYNREVFPDNIRNKVNKIYNNRVKKNSKKNKNKINYESIVKAKCVDVFSKIDLFGYQTNIDWFYYKPTPTLRYFFRKLLSYWNYKFGLTSAMKEKLLPEGDIINSNISIIRNPPRNRYKLIEKILDVLDKLVSSATSSDDRNVGCIIVLYSLAEISRECINSNPWLQ